MQQNQTQPTAPAQSQRSDDDEIDLARLLGLLIDHRWFIIITTAVFMVIGVAYALLATPIYQADALLQVEKKSSGLPAIGEMSELFATESEAATEIEIMKSRMVVGAVVDQLKLTNVVEPDYLPIIGNYLARRSGEKDAVQVEMLQVPPNQVGKELHLEFVDNNFALYNDDGDRVLDGVVGTPAESGEWMLHVSAVQNPNTDHFKVSKTSHLGAVNYWQSKLKVSERGKQTGILNATLQDSDSSLAVQVLDAISNEYMLQNIRRNAAEAENSLEFLQKQIPTIKDNLNDAEEQLNKYRLQSQSVDLSIETQGLLDQVIEIERRINELSLKEAEISRLYTKSHPTYQALLEQKQNLESDLNKLTDQVQLLPETQQQVLRLARDVEVNQEIYLALLNRMQELNVLKAGTVGNVRILDQAAPSPRVVSPKRNLVVVLAVLLGGISSIGYIFVFAALNRGIERAEQLEDEGINVYASVPLSEVQEQMNEKLTRLARRSRGESLKAPLLAKDDPTDLAIEALRGLRTSLHFAMLEARNNVIMISGPSPGVGKSFVTANLAAVLAQSGQKVLMIDGDIRRGYLHNMMNSKNDYGLSDLLAARDQGNTKIGIANYQDIIVSSPIENMQFMPRGTAAPNPSELLMHPRMTELLEAASNDFDYVLIDTPPVLAVTDASIVGRYAGTTLLVARFGMTPTKEMVQTVKRFNQNGVEVKGVILNSVERKASAYYGYGYGYHYGYSYKS
ncbi:tyrosine-protein kinase [Pseudidiomarina aestuarii]|uniref:Tyrosine-protein kinase n=1 Tax=Pseudidiomarina aestuarii TaxID=624146 RepID=A0A7Z6ZUF8_9GAMM|nr:polysaccharide biosynthesis tyrosine autokinase [Pseudidiomarina aestuarii]RUO41624.1 tyrosine-protein kinase [Pseudidiomarina aestuarii]